MWGTLSQQLSSSSSSSDRDVLLLFLFVDEDGDREITDKSTGCMVVIFLCCFSLKTIVITNLNEMIDVFRAERGKGKERDSQQMSGGQLQQQHSEQVERASEEVEMKI